MWGIQPSEFWRMSPAEWWLVYDGKRVEIDAKTKALSPGAKFSKDEVDMMRQMHEEAKANV